MTAILIFIALLGLGIHTPPPRVGTQAFALVNREISNMEYWSHVDNGDPDKPAERPTRGARLAQIERKLVKPLHSPRVI
jgi:hypothetical protein